MEDPYNLQRFISAQSQVMGRVLQELEQGKKQSHWMWFVFPQITGLGRTPTSEHYAIKSEAEAGAFLEHPELGQRLVDCTRVVNRHTSLTAEQIFGHPDYLKFRSCMTLFAAVSADTSNPFTEALQKYFDSKPDSLTLSILDTIRAG